MQFSPSTGCFYPDDITYTDAPGDLIEVSDADYTKCMSRAADETFSYADGTFTISKAPGATAEQVKASVKAQALSLLTATDYTQVADTAAALSNSAAFTAYRAAIRAIYADPPADPTWPTVPEPVWS